MNLIISQKAATSDFLDNGCKIHKVDERGFYLCNLAGHLYLHNTGKIHNGIANSTAFWGTEEAAFEFYTKWEEKNNKQMQTEACICPMFAEHGSDCAYKSKQGLCEWPR